MLLACDLCGESLPDAGRRCPRCGLYRGGFITTAPSTYWRLAGAFVAVYAATIVVVALAR
jgi:hypothetical protein